MRVITSWVGYFIFVVGLSCCGASDVVWFCGCLIVMMFNSVG